MARYIGLVDGEKGAYGITFPDLPGCTSMDETIDAVTKNAVEAVRMWVEDAIAEGKPLPVARTIDDLVGDAEISGALASGAVAVAVPLLMDSGGRRRRIFRSTRGS